jgi:ABC-2 type transport system ATP-binding protein
MVIDVVARGNLDEIHRFISSIAGVETITHLDSLEGETHTLRVESRENEDIRERLSSAIVEKGFGLLGLKAVDMSLEDIFVQLVTKEETS